MRDSYPAYATIPSGALVPPERQPEYLAAPPDLLGVVDVGTAEAILRPPDFGERRDATAIVHHESGSSLTFGDLDDAAARIANALRGIGVEPGDRVAFRSGNRPEGIVAALATWRAQATVVPIPMHATASDLRWYLRDTGAKVLITQGGPAHADVVEAGVVDTSVTDVIVFGDAKLGSVRCREWSALLAESDASVGKTPHPDMPAIIWHTGGTTGTPKACYHTHRRFLAGGYSIGRATGVGRGERWAAAAPIGHALGFLYHTIYTLLHGATIVLIEGFARPEVVLAALAEHEVDTFTAISATWARMKDVIEANPDAVRPPRLRRAYAMWQSASSSDVYDWWKDRGVRLLNNFGSTAFATWVLVPQDHDGREKPASLGRPAPGYEVIAIDPDADSLQPVPAGTPGRMAVRGLTGLTYWARPELQQRDVVDGWTLVDDMIQFDDGGDAAYLGRTDFLISTAGYKVAPVEVEAALATHPAVREVAVVGTPDAVRTEIVTAFVVLREGHEPSDELRAALQDHVKQRVAPYKYPRRIEFIAALPRDHVGKVQQRVLKDVYAAREART